MAGPALTFRPPVPGDWPRVMAVMPEWWGGRDLRGLLPSIFFEHFRTTSLIVEHEGDLVAFLVGFVCPTHPDEAYVHFVGVSPVWRRAGLARDLYGRFFRIAEAQGRHVIRAVTSHVNKTSIAFHTRLGFAVVHSPHEIEGVPVRLDEDGPGQHRVHFELRLDGSAAADGEARA